MTSVHVTCIIRCPHLYQKQQSPQAPSRRPCTTAHASQIPTRLGSTYGPRYHTFPQLPHTVTKLQKSRHWFRRDQRVQFHKSQPTLSANIQNLRYNPANQAPAKSSKSHMPATGGGVQSPPACTAMVIYIHGYAHGQAHTFTCTVTHAHTFTGMRISARLWRKPARRDQRTAQQIPNQPCQANTLKLRNASTNLQSNRPTQNTWGAWVWRQRRRRRCDVCDVRGPARLCNRAIGPEGPITVKPKGLTGLKAGQMAHLKVG